MERANLVVLMTSGGRPGEERLDLSEKLLTGLGGAENCVGGVVAKVVEKDWESGESAHSDGGVDEAREAELLRLSQAGQSRGLKSLLL